MSNLVFKVIGFVLSLTIGQAIVIAGIVYVAYLAGALGLFG